MCKEEGSTVLEMPNESYAKFEHRIHQLVTARELEAIMAAYVFSKYGHRGQFRDDGTTRYFDHARAVALTCIDELNLYDKQILVMALLHDIREDTYLLGPYRMELNFGREIMLGVTLMTKEKGSPTNYVDQLAKHGSWKVLTVKLCDRLHNLRTLDTCTLEKRYSQIAETVNEYLPLIPILLSRLPRSKRYIAKYLDGKIREQIEKHQRALSLTS
ncbi:MAG TPA: HD domain-containing protein [Candidatus Saccharimonadales bacterium]|nr:HD domain-containing protein [Candidatus Saccharimonadales bacterium]